MHACTMLRGKLMDLFTTLTMAEKADTGTMKKTLADRAGPTKDPLALAAREFDERRHAGVQSLTMAEKADTGTMKKTLAGL